MVNQAAIRVSASIKPAKTDFCDNVTRPELRLAEVVSSLSRALDLSTGQPPGHSVRACLIGMHIAAEIGLSATLSADLFYGLLLKDCGCSGNASKTFHAFGSDDLKAKRDVKTTDWTRMSWETVRYALDHVATGKSYLERSKALFRLAIKEKTHAKDVIKIRCERGATLARLMGLSDTTALGILNLDEHWDGRGHPDGLRRTEIPLLSRIMLLAQTLEVFLASTGIQSAIDVAENRKGTWFDPDLVQAVHSLSQRGQIWKDAMSEDFANLCLRRDPDSRTMEWCDSTMDNICMAFANIVDAKSPFSFNHSVGVANATVATARMLGLPRDQILFLRHAALLHDLGKLGVSNSILEKPAKLTDDEWKSMRQHPFHTWDILRSIPGFAQLSEVAGSHHEKLDGSGYFRGLSAEHLSLDARILAVADIFDALSAKRPYRDSLPLEKVFGIMEKDSPHGLDPLCLEALKQSGTECNQNFVDLWNLTKQLE